MIYMGVGCRTANGIALGFLCVGGGDGDVASCALKRMVEWNDRLPFWGRDGFMAISTVGDTVLQPRHFICVKRGTVCLDVD